MAAVEKIYTACWKENLSLIKIHLKKDLQIGQTFKIEKIPIEKASRKGRPSGFDFNLVIDKGKLQLSANSVVGKNLWEVLDTDLKCKELISQKKIEIKMNRDFWLTIKSID